MKAILKLLPILLTFFWVTNLNGQTITTAAGAVTSCPGEIAVPVNVTNCNGIGAISLVLNYDTSKLTYLGYQNLNSALATGIYNVNRYGNHIVFSWANTTAANVGTGSLLTLRFNAIPATTSLTWDTQTPGNCEYSDINGTILPAAFTNGIVTINQPPVITSQPVDKTVLVGQNTSFSLSSTGAGVAYLWQISTNGGSTWTDLANNAVYSGVTSSTLGITNALMTYSGYKYRCRLTGTCTPVIYSNVVTLTVLNPVTTILPTASFCPSNIVVPVSVTNFTGIASFSLTFSYNTSCLQYTGYQSLNGALAGANFAINASGGKLFLAWSSISAVTFGNGTLIELLFTATTGTSPLVWDDLTPGNCEYTDFNGLPVATVFTDGSETIHALPAITAQPSGKTIAKGQNTTFSVTASGTGISYLWQISTNGGSTFTDLTNSGYYSNVTTSTLTITNAQLAISGYQYRCKVSGTCLPVVYSGAAILTVLPNIITTCGSTTVCPGQVIIPVTVSDFIGVASLSLTLNYNSSVLTYTGYQNLNTALGPGVFTSNAAGGKVYISWLNTTAATIANGGVLIELLFTGTPGSATLSWDTQTPGNCEFSDLSGVVFFSSWTNGNATINAPPSISAHPANRTIYSGGSTTMSVSATGTGLAYSWQVSANSGSTWTNLTNTAPYSGVTSTTLTINPAATGINGYLYRCIVSGTCTPAVTSNSAMLTVTQAAITTTPGGITGSCTGNLSIPLNVVNCNSVGSISLTLIYDTTKMSYEGYQAVNAALSGGILAVNRSGNEIIMSWASTTGITIGAGTLLQYRFRANAGISTTLSWDTPTPGACEYSDINGNVITSFYNSATISTSATALIVNAGPDVVKTGASVQLTGLASGGTIPYAWAWTPAASLSNPAIYNPVASPAITTTYTLTVTAAGCSGSDVVDVIVNGVPATLSLQDITISGGTTQCFNATNTISVAGTGTIFVITNGGRATMIAGQKISYLPGTRVFSGGYMRGYITTNGQFCNAAASPVFNKLSGVDENKQSGEDLFHVYPNPTTGTFFVEFPEQWTDRKPKLIIFNTSGAMVLTREITDVSDRENSLSGQPSGMYFIRLISDEQVFTRVLIKK